MRQIEPSMMRVACRALFLVVAIVFLPVVARAASISVWHAYRGDEEQALIAVAQRYEARAHVRVDLLAVPFEAYASKLSSAIPNGHGPDLFIDAHERIGVYLGERLIVPAGDALPDADAARFDDVAIRAVTFDGVRYGVPLATKSLVLYVNNALFSGKIESLEDLVRLRASLPSDLFPIAYEATSAYYHAAFLHAFGGRLFDSGKFAFDSEPSAQALEYVHRLSVDRVIPEEMSGALVTRLFLSGHAVAVIGGTWFSAEIGNGVDYRVVPLPPLREGGGPMRSFLTVDTAFVTPTGARREVREFAGWLGADESAEIRTRIGKQVAAVKGGDMGDAIPMPSDRAMRAAWEPANRAIAKVLRDGASPRDALAESRRRYDEAVRPAPPSASPTPALVVIGALLFVGALALVRRAKAQTPMPHHTKLDRPSEAKTSLSSASRRKLLGLSYASPAALSILALVILPLIAGAGASLFTNLRDTPRYVGLANYVAILTANGQSLLSHGSFYFTLLVTVIWTIANLALHVAIGLALGTLLSRPSLRFRGAYRVLLILPWAVPSYITALVWKGMFQRQFGAINAILSAFDIAPISWFSRFSTAFTANLITNVWLGFPFMMVVTIGALTAVPSDVLEAAEVDGATRLQRFFRVSLPLVKPVLAPAIVLGAIWTFNMFNVVFLVSGGEPDGTTDTLVAEAYRWAFTRDAQYGYAAAYAVIIFAMLTVGSWISVRGRRVAES